MQKLLTVPLMVVPSSCSVWDGGAEQQHIVGICEPGLGSLSFEQVQEMDHILVQNPLEGVLHLEGDVSGRRGDELEVTARALSSC